MPGETEITDATFHGLKKLGMELLNQAQDAHGFLGSSTRNAIKYSDPELRKDVQDKLNHAVGLLCVAHVMAIFEDHFPEKYWKLILEDETLLDRLFAFRHIRRCAANGFTGRRPTEDHAAFNSVMTSTDPLSGIKFHNEEEIRLNEDAGNHACAFLRTLTDKAIVEVYKRIS